MIIKKLITGKSGTEHFIMQSITAIALIPLVIWFCLSLAFLPDANYATVVAWFNSPFNAVLIIATLIIGFYHALLGMQTIFEDYISTHSTRKKAIFISNIVLVFFTIIGVLSVLIILISG